MSANTSCENEVWAILSANEHNATALHTLTSSQWVSASNFRGTMDILQSCVLTLVACVYTALHLNIPERRSWSSQLAEKARSVFTTVLVPEIALVSAAGQLLQAWQFKNAMINLQIKSDNEEVKKVRILKSGSNSPLYFLLTILQGSHSSKQYNITLTYAFFVAMGGIRVPKSKLTRILSVNGAEPAELWDPTRGATIILTTYGAWKLAERGIWFYVTESTINDKSKANTIQKALVLCQVSWMFLQCISRKAYGLPITILELHTLVHVFCACLMYAFWLKKPLDVTEPEVRFEESWLNLLAVMVQASFYYEMHIENENLEHGGPTPNMSEDRVCAENRWERVMEEFVAQSSKYDTPRSLLQAHYGGVIHQSQGMLPLWSRSPPESCDGIDGVGESVGYLASNTANLHSFYFLAFVLSAVYAGIHMSAWNGTFPTSYELQTWRACCLFLAFGPIAAYLLSLLGDYFCAGHPLRGQSEVSWASLNSYVIFGLLVLFHCYAKLFIVVESFISLRLVPIGVYWTPMWLQMIPHA